MALFGRSPKKEGSKPAAPARPGTSLIKPGSGEKGTKGKAREKKLKADTRLAYRVLLRPIISEKSTLLAEQNTYVFRVALASTRAEVARAVYHIYGVKPKAVHVINVLGKRRRQGKSMGRTQDWKKAMVTLPAGQKIQVYEGA